MLHHRKNVFCTTLKVLLGDAHLRCRRPGSHYSIISKQSPDLTTVAPMAALNEKGVPVNVDSGSSAASTHSHGSTEEHVFSNPQTAEHWRGVYEAAHYEGRHRFDPSFTWTAAEEKKLVRKVCQYSGVAYNVNVTDFRFSWICESHCGHGSCSARSI